MTYFPPFFVSPPHDAKQHSSGQNRAAPPPSNCVSGSLTEANDPDFAALTAATLILKAMRFDFELDFFLFATPSQSTPV